MVPKVGLYTYLKTSLSPTNSLSRCAVASVEVTVQCSGECHCMVPKVGLYTYLKMSLSPTNPLPRCAFVEMSSVPLSGSVVPLGPKP